MIVEREGKFYVESEKGKSLGGPYDTKAAAEKRLKEVEMFKHMETNSLQRVVSNVAAPKVRRDSMEGREYLVVPMVMLTEGVHAGSCGPLYYPGDELAKTPAVWNHKPIVVYHPQINGVGVSACDPDILTSRKVGVIMGARYEKGKLKAEAWLEESRVQKVDDRIAAALQANAMMEVSTGLFTDNEGPGGEWNGEQYAAIARNFRPDHLAILPDQKGACSIDDGAGLLRLNQAASGGTGVFADAARAFLRVFAENAQSHNQIWRQLSDMLSAKFRADDPRPYVEDVFDGFFIYSQATTKGSKLWKVEYALDGDAVKVKNWAPVEVVRATEYRTAAGGDYVGNQTKEKKMDKDKLVAEVIKNSAGVWTDEDKTFLTGLSEEKLKKLAEPVKNAAAPAKVESAPAAPAKAPEPAPAKAPTQEAPAANKAATVEEYIANAPEGVRDMLAAGLAAHRAEKAKLVAAIVANKACRFTAAQLEVKGLEELKLLAELAAQPAAAPATYAGAGPAAQPTTNAAKAEEPLALPSMDFSAK